MPNTLLIRGARQLLTLRGLSSPRRGAMLSELGLIPDGAMLIEDGRIVEVGVSRRIENLAAARRAVEIDASGCVVMPGFVDCHTHPLLSRPSYELIPLTGSNYRDAEHTATILSSLRAVREASCRQLEQQLIQHVKALVRHGTTTLEAKTGLALNEGEFKLLKVLRSLDRNPLDIVPTYLGANVVPPEFEHAPENYLAWICHDVLPRIGQQRLARFADVNCQRTAFSLEQARQYLLAARQAGLFLKIHGEQFSRDGATRLAVELNAVSVDHLVYADLSDAALLARCFTIAVLLPAAVFHMGGNRYAPARQLIDAGAAVALGTDFNGSSSPTFNMQMVVHLACTRMGMKPEEAIAAATINAAHAILMADRVGSLEVGKEADVIIVNVGDFRDLGFLFGGNLVRATLKRGRILYEEGEVDCCAA